MANTRSTPIRLLIVDDHEVLRLGLRTLFAESDGFDVVGEARTMAEAIAEAERLHPQVILMDVRLPDGTGIEACRQIRAAQPDIRFLFLTSYVDDEAVLATILAGAQGFLLKDVASVDLVTAVKRVAEGHSILDPAVTQRVLGQLQAFAAHAPPKGEALSAQEQRVLALVAEGKTNKEIAAALQLSDKTVGNYLSNVFQKLHVTRRAQAAAYFTRHFKP